MSGLVMAKNVCPNQFEYQERLYENTARGYRVCIGPDSGSRLNEVQARTDGRARPTH